MLDGEKDSLSVKLFNLKEDNLKMINSYVNDTIIIKNSIIKQREVLTDLINTIKTKINLIQQSQCVV
jgi:hypothetical protein